MDGSGLDPGRTLATMAVGECHMRLATSLVIAMTSATLHGDPVEISIDGAFQDWDGVPIAWQDATGDASADIDMTSLWIANDDRFLFLRLEATEEFDLSENNNLKFYLDTDNDASTGLTIGGIGAELEWRAGERIGTFFHDDDSTVVYHDAIRFRGIPTITSTQFEMCFGRNMNPDESNPLFPGQTVRLLIKDGDNGDQVPDAGDVIEYTFDPDTGPGPDIISLVRDDPKIVRMITHNVKTDRITDNQYEDSFERMYVAVDADILHLQEIYESTADDIEQLIEDWLGGNWYSASVNDCKTISRFPIQDAWAIDGNLAVLIDTSDVLGTPVLCINAHLPCCSNDEGRQAESDAIMAFIRDAYLPGGNVFLGPEVPVMIAGDLNLVGLARQLETLVTGDIQDEDTYGPDQEPDPDGSNLTNIISRLTEKRMGYTWRNDFSSFWPGHLDYLIYSDSNMSLRKDFILYTPEMSQNSLDAYGLDFWDSTASDHLVFCADFAAPCFGDITNDGNVDVNDLLIMLADWETTDPDSDINDDGLVDADDILALLSSWGSCGS